MAAESRPGLPPSFVDDLIDGALEVGADAVHLVDEADARHAVLVGLDASTVSDCGSTPATGVEHGDRAVEDAQRALDFRP
jgi:hypothetical protein